MLLAGLVVVPGRGLSSARLQGPTDEQITLADIEVRRLVTLLRLEPGMTVADVGAGLGAWSLRFSQWTGPSGHVYATDIGVEQLAALRALVAREGLSNVTVIAGATASTDLPAGCCDAILLRKVRFEADGMSSKAQSRIRSPGNRRITDTWTRGSERGTFQIRRL